MQITPRSSTLSSILQESVNLVFATFFQHFLSENSTGGGGRAYISIKYTLPGDLLPILNQTSNNSIEVYQDMKSSVPVDDTVLAALSLPTNKLEMSKAAVGLCLGVLLFLTITSLIGV